MELTVDGMGAVKVDNRGPVLGWVDEMGALFAIRVEADQIDEGWPKLTVYGSTMQDALVAFADEITVRGLL